MGFYKFTMIFQKLIVICLSRGDDHDPSKTAVKTASAAILARILVMNTNYLAQLTSDPSLLAHLQKAGISSEESILLCLVDVWLDKVSKWFLHQKFVFCSLPEKTINILTQVISTSSVSLYISLVKPGQTMTICLSLVHAKCYSFVHKK